MESKLNTIFARLKQITPDQAFLSRSKASILATAQEAVRPRTTLFSVRERFVFIPALAFGALLLVTISLGAFVNPTDDVLLTNAPAVSSSEDLTREAEKVDFSIKIAEVNYFDESAEQVALALDEIAKE
jgi:hypothetical protein